MKREFKITSLFIVGFSLVAGWSDASEPQSVRKLEASDIMNSAHASYYYAADGGKAHVKMTMTNKKGRSRVREFWLLRTDIEDLGDQNYYVYFTSPSDVRRTSVLTLKHADRSDDRWLYVPSVDLVKRIAADNKQESFVGSDFTFEDISGRLPSLDNHEFLPTEEVDLIVIKSTPLNAKSSNYAYRLNWIDTKPTKKEFQHYMLPVREEYYNDQDVLLRVFTIDSIEVIEGVPTAVIRTMKNIKKKHSTTIELSHITYKVELKASDYRERLLKNPPRSLR